MNSQNIITSDYNHLVEPFETQLMVLGLNLIVHRTFFNLIKISILLLFFTSQNIFGATSWEKLPIIMRVSKSCIQMIHHSRLACKRVIKTSNYYLILNVNCGKVCAKTW